jgi:transcriptional repressor NrdR
VVDSREADDGITVRRRRECEKCGFRFTTYERQEQARLMVVKKDGTRDLFSRDKMAQGIYKAFYKRPTPVARIEKLIDDIERELYEKNVEEISSSTIGELVINKIERVDQVAYIRFSAVYREFRDLQTFEDEIKRLIQKGEKTAKR